MKCRVMYKADGTVAVIHPAPKARRINVEFPKGWVPPHTKVAEKAATIYSLNDNPSGRSQIAYIRSIGGKAKIESDEDFLKRIYEKAVKGTELEGLPYDDIEPSALPHTPDGKKLDRDKWRGKKGEGVKVDPSVITIAEKRQAIEDKLDAELAKASPNLVQVIKLQRKLDKKEY